MTDGAGLGRKRSRKLFSYWRSSVASSRSNGRAPTLYALRPTLALPSGVLGPVDRSHGRQRLIASDFRVSLLKGRPGYAVGAGFFSLHSTFRSWSLMITLLEN